MQPIGRSGTTQIKQYHTLRYVGKRNWFIHLILKFALEYLCKVFK